MTIGSSQVFYSPQKINLLLPLCRQIFRDLNSLGTSAELSGTTSEDLGSGGVPH